MSLDSEGDSHDDHTTCSTVDDEAYEPTYAEAFPPLPVAVTDAVDPLPPHQPSSNKWSAAASRMALRSSVITQVNNPVTKVSQQKCL